MRNLLFKILLVFLGMAVFLNSLSAQDLSGNKWSAQTISSDYTVSLTEDIELVGCITVKDATLTILNETDKNIVIKCSKASISMFSVSTSGKLVIKGNANGRVIIDGGAAFTWSENRTELPVMRLTPSSEGIKIQKGIDNNGELFLEYTTIQNVNGTSTYGGAITVKSSKNTKLNYCVIKNCYALCGSALMINNPSTGLVEIFNTDIICCISGGYKCEKQDNLGGAIRTVGRVTSSLYLTNCSFLYNYAMREYNEYDNTLPHDGNGGALFWNARGTTETKCVINGCTFKFNRSDDNGGAIKSQGTLNFVGETTEISDNYAPNGAGLYIEGYSGSNKVGTSVILNDLNDKLYIHDNVSHSYNYNGNTFSGKGAGIHFYFGKEMTLEPGSSISVDLCGAILENNKAEGDDAKGAGIYFEDTSPSDKNYTFDIELNSGTINSNTSEGNGGGVYIHKGNVSSSSTGTSQLKISSNNAEASGAGVYITGGGNLSITGGVITGNSSKGNGGGAYIAGGNLSVTNGEISSNSAVESGGGVAIVDGKVEMENGSIGKNTSQNYGGGVYVSNTSDTQQSVVLTGGSLVGNSARYGGGLCVDGNIKLTVGDIEIDGNSAENGGGICLINNADMDFGAGQIKNNSANGTTGINLVTAYKKGISEVSGIGGGIYVGTGTKLAFTQVSSFGLYNNIASGGADDIFANGDGTSVTLPDVTKMALSGYAGATNLRWMEDYITNDPNYGYGTKINDGWNESSPVNLRYRDANNSNQSTYEVDGGTSVVLQNYVSLAIGYEIIQITITKYGLQNGESAIFKLSKGDVSFPVIITGVQGKEYVSKEVIVTAGEWKIEETGWSWSYQMIEPALGRSITKNVADVANRTFIFKNSKISSGLPRYDETYRLNLMGTGD